MSTRAFLFPGQGSQEVGMAADLFKEDPFFQSLVDLGSARSGEDLRTLCLRGPEKRLQRAEFLQPLLVAVSLGYLRRLEARGLRPDVALGHSLGEISALAAAGVVTCEQAVEIAACRGRLMQEAAAAVDGGMLAVICADRAPVLRVLSEEGGGTRAVLANDNAPDQIILSGERTALEAVARRAAAERLGRCRWLAVSGPWHSPFMEPARERFAQWVETIPFLRPRIPIVFNASGRPEAEPQAIKEQITRVLAAPVQWRAAMEHLKTLHANELLEVGPGRILAGLARANGFKDDARIHTVNNLRGVDLATATLRP